MTTIDTEMKKRIEEKLELEKKQKEFERKERKRILRLASGLTVATLAAGGFVTGFLFLFGITVSFKLTTLIIATAITEWSVRTFDLI